MPTPDGQLTDEELKALEGYEMYYDMFRANTDDASAFQKALQLKQDEDSARQEESVFQEQQEALKEKRFGDVAPEVLDVLDIGSDQIANPNAYQPFSQFLPGFNPEIPEPKFQPQAASYTSRPKNLYDPRGS